MADKTSTRYQRLLRRQLKAFLSSPGPNSSVKSALANWNDRGWHPLLFGGILRDILVLGASVRPRDIDVVISNASPEEIEEALRPYITHRNRFGGFRLELNRWHFDLWPLQKTWAFEQGKVFAATMENLPKTTFLNVEAIAISIGSKGVPGEVFDSGFFRAVESKILDINLIDNPYPGLAAVRALTTALKLQYQLSARLADYVVEAEQRFGVDALIAAQSSHYGVVRLRGDAIRNFVEHISRKLRENADAPVFLPGVKDEQLLLWQ